MHRLRLLPLPRPLSLALAVLVGLAAPSPAHATAIVLSLATPDVATVGTTLQAYTVPAGTRWCQVYSTTYAAYLQWTGTDGGSKSTDNLFIPADTWVEWRIPGSGTGNDHLRAARSIYIATANASGSITIQCTADGN